MSDRHKTKMTGIRLDEDDRQAIEEIATALHKEGVNGMTNLDGSAVITNVVRYLVRKERERLRNKKE